ncbi:hypothetical protein JQN72_10820 [Phycicoccus sp. CSK15P-2]|uniref:hypothetical protein n=1 Tax=Phycicoccus sp. CSK15P-2 TaxID=2807627 RepID=UPI001950B2EB|nr:hypothetical protein [Phycicoccus sp. CSK15P-2]MBM6404734.1 hypothetical protein [Phycicoccus sp. CSK15P-2]
MAVPDVDDEAGVLHGDVRAHLERLTEAAETDIDRLDHSAFEAALTSRLVGAERIQSTGLGFSYASPFATHLHEVLTLDLPTAVVTLPDDRVQESGMRLPKLMDRARRNLCTLMHSVPAEVMRVGDGSRSVTAVMSDSPYTASFARFLADAVELWTPGADQGGGIVFALPHRHAVVFQVCATPQQTRDALDLVPLQAEAMQADGLTPVSPHVYHWLDRRITCLTTENTDGSLRLGTTPELDSLMGLRRAV